MPEGGRGPARQLLIVLLAAAVTGLPSLFPGFIHDDHRIIEQNELIRDSGRLGSVLTRGYWTVNEAEVPNLYRPVTILSFAVNHALGGLRPFGYRLVNLALHALVAALVFALGRRVLGPPAPRSALDPALLAGLLFAVHPVHTEALGLVVGRSELLAAAGTILAVLLFLRGRDRAAAGEPRRAAALDALSLSAFALGFLSKENAVAAPFIVLAVDLTRRREPRELPPRPAWRYHLAAAAILILLLAARTAILGDLGPSRFTHFIDNPIAHQPLLPGRLTALKALVRDAVLLVFPLRLSIDYSYKALPPAASAMEGQVIAGGLLVLAFAAAVAWAWKRRPAVACSLLIVGLALAPVSNLLFPIGTILAERLLYLPSAGYCLLVAALLAPASLPTGHRSVALRILLVTALGLLAARSALRLLDWRDDRTIFAAAVATTPDSARAQFNYGVASEEAGDGATAERAYRAAVDIWPGFSDAHYNLAGLLARRNDFEGAVAHYREASRAQPGNVEVLVNLGHTLNQAGRSEEALAPLERAVSIDPKSDRGWTNLGTAYLALGRAREAVSAYDQAARLDAGSADYLVNVALAREAVPDFAGAAQAYSGAASLRPADAILRYRQGRALEQAGLGAEAAAAYRESIRLSPQSPVPHRSLGLLLFRSGDREGARQALERAQSLDVRGQVMDDEARTLLERLRQKTNTPAGPRAHQGG